ncbi:hypothetical protein FIE12Z_8105 [Fusarium flagelliforme]|uniref:Methyltransferase domain-containing protein n=1 Tax=Fusarium flagelliforme TaxID=2675880 RepID=A0A395MIA3_9HYPO|nr:hypothetical protein FIE12Z_8105 [Fusarium flagelliforme]
MASATTPKKGAPPGALSPAHGSDTDEDHLEPDVPADDDSAIGVTDDEISTASLRSSIRGYHMINGRGYHRDETYYLPSDEHESERLDLQNHQLLLTFGGKKCFAPNAETAKRVLDVGTGTGIWAVEFADENPHAEVVGIDIAAIQPALGGWLEIIDPTFPAKSDDGTLKPTSPLHKWDELTVKGAATLGRPFIESKDHERRMKEAGFTNITKKTFKWPSNTWPKDPQYKEIGLWTLANIERNLESISSFLLRQGLGMTHEEIVVFIANVREEMRNTKVHAYWEVIMVTGQKPA